MLSSFLFTLVLAACALATKKEPEPVDPLAAKLAGVRAAPNMVGRIKALDSADFKFNFGAAKPTTGAGGQLFASNVAVMPALDGLDISITVGKLEACGMNTPHTHPRATEFLYLVNGDLFTGFLQENGAPFIVNNITKDEGHVFPQGSIHFQANLGCEPVLFVAALNSEDPGASQVAQRFFGLDPEVVDAALGGLPNGYVEVLGLEDRIPDNVAIGLQSCLERCGLKRGTQPTAQLQPEFGNEPKNEKDNSGAIRGSGNYKSNNSRSALNTNSVFGAVAEDASTVGAAGGVSTNVVIALAAVIGALALGYIAIGIYFLVQRRRAADKPNRWYVRPEMAGRTRVADGEKDEVFQAKYDSAP